MILVSGGAGYIGSHYVLHEQGRGENLLILDNLVLGHREAADGIPLMVGDTRDRVALDRIFNENPIEAVVHFAAFAAVGESVERPDLYYGNNVIGTLTLLDAMVAHKVKRFVFSSTCATYGNPQYVPMDEKHPQNPINPYGESKRMVEQILQWYDRAFGLKFIALRYFNAAGCDPDGRIGESHNPERHLIPIVLQAAKGERESIIVYGDDYPTPDGTCIRDYIHVLDLAAAHSLALKRLRDGGSSAFYNLGTGAGYSVRQVIEVCRKITGRPIKETIGPRRSGDPPELVAKAERAQKELNWQPQYADMERIVQTAWIWEQNRRY